MDAFVWDLFTRTFNEVPDNAWVCMNTLVGVLGPVDNMKKTIRALKIPYEHTTTCVRTDALYARGGPISMATRGSGTGDVYAYPDPSQQTTKRSTLLLIRPSDAQHFILQTWASVRLALITLVRNVQQLQDPP